MSGQGRLSRQRSLRRCFSSSDYSCIVWIRLVSVLPNPGICPDAQGPSLGLGLESTIKVSHVSCPHTKEFSCKVCGEEALLLSDPSRYCKWKMPLRSKGRMAWHSWSMWDTGPSNAARTLDRKLDVPHLQPLEPTATHSAPPGVWASHKGPVSCAIGL